MLTLSVLALAACTAAIRSAPLVHAKMANSRRCSRVSSNSGRQFRREGNDARFRDGFILALLDSRLCRRQTRKKVRQRPFIVLPPPRRLPVDRLADLDHAGGADRPLRAVKLQAGRFPIQPARRHQPPRDRFQVGHGLFVNHFLDRHRQHGRQWSITRRYCAKREARCSGSLAQRMLRKSVIQQETATSRRSRRQWMNAARGNMAARRPRYR